MSALTIEIPEDILIPTGQTREGFIEEAKFLLAAKLFELGRLSLEAPPSCAAWTG